MAQRGSAARRNPGNPLGGVLRDLDRRARTMEHKPDRPGPAGPPGQAGPEGSTGRPGEPGPVGPRGFSPAAAIAATGDDGRVTWRFDEPMLSVPVVSAVPVDPDPGDASTVTVALEQVSAESVTVRVWRTQALLGLGLLPSVPAGSGIQVHLTALQKAPPAS